MKYYALLLSTVITPLSFAMEPLVEIRNRDLDTLQKPHIIIINKLPKDAGFSTRIDISDKTKIYDYTKDSYRPDESTKTIWPGQGIRFSPYFNKNGKPDYRRLGMNDTGNAALIALHIHGIKHSHKHLFIGEGSRIRFGDTIIITANNNDIIIELPDDVSYPEEPLDICATLTSSLPNDTLILKSGAQVTFLPNTFLNGGINGEYTARMLADWELALCGWGYYLNSVDENDTDSAEIFSDNSEDLENSK